MPPPGNTTPAITPGVAVIFVDVARRGIALQVHPGTDGENLRFHLRSVMPLAQAMRHAWNERLNGCMMEGEMSLKDAESIALAEIEVLDSS